MNNRDYDPHPSVTRTLLIALLGAIVSNGYAIVFLAWGNS